MRRFFSALLPPTQSRKTFVIALTVLLLVGGIEIGTICWIVGREKLFSSGDTITREAEIAELSSDPQPKESKAGLVPAVPTVPTTPTVVVGSLESRLTHAKSLRLAGEHKTALENLLEILADYPNQAGALAELGIIYENLQMPDKAVGQWQKLYDQGPSIGAPYYLAEARLRNVGLAPVALTTTSAKHNGADSFKSLNSSKIPSRSMRPNALMYFGNIFFDEQNEPNLGKKVVLKTEVASNSSMIIDPRDVKVETYFYDLVDGKKYLLTDAETSYKWLTSPVTWENQPLQLLETTYLRPKSASNGLGKKGNGAVKNRKLKGSGMDSNDNDLPGNSGNRTYGGYEVRLYYKHQLQDAKANPADLLNQFPPPLEQGDGVEMEE